MPVPPQPPGPQDNPYNWQDHFRDFTPSEDPPFPPSSDWQHLNRNSVFAGNPAMAPGGAGIVEVHGSRTFSYIGNTFKAQRIFQTPWETKMRWVAKLMGYPILKNISGADPYISRNLPYTYEFYQDRAPGLDNDDEAKNGPKMWATGLEMVEPKGPALRNRDKELIADQDYPYAHLRVLFESLPYTCREDADVMVNTGGANEIPVDYGYEALARNHRFVTRIIQPQIEILRLPFGFYKWADGIKYSGVVKAERGQSVATGYFKTLPYSEITYIWHQVPELPSTGWNVMPTSSGGVPQKENPLVGAMFTHVGCVNDEWFDGFPPESLLLTAVEARMYKWVTGQRLYDYVYKCKYMNPLDEIPTGAAIYYMTGGGELTEVAKGVGGYVPRNLGHNHFLRYPFPKDASEGSLVQPYYSYMTHNGHQDGRPIYSKRDYREMFRPFNRAYLAKKYGLV